MWRLVCNLVACWLLAGVVHAETTAHLQLGIKSDAFYRGFNQAHDGSPVYQGQVEIRHGSGLYAGVWLSSVDFAADQRQREIDYFAGYQRRWTDWLATDVTLQRYTFDADVRGDSYNWTELQVAAHAGQRWTLHAAQGRNWGGRGKHSRIGEVTYRHPLPAGVTAYATFGRHFARDVLGDNFNYMEAGLAGNLLGFDVQMGWVDTSKNPLPWVTADNKWLVGVSRQFSFGL